MSTAIPPPVIPEAEPQPRLSGTSAKRGRPARRDPGSERCSLSADGAWPKWLRRGPLELVASLAIGAGVLMLLQPLSMTLYSYSFITTLAGVAAFMIVSKFPD